MCGPSESGWCSYCNTTETHHLPSCPLVIKKEEDKKKHEEDITILNQHRIRDRSRAERREAGRDD